MCRYGVTDAPEEFLAAIGEAPFETSPISIDATRVEGWNTEAVDLNPAERRTIQLRRNPADYAHQGAPGASTFSGKER